jgi:hypothetical protein
LGAKATFDYFFASGKTGLAEPTLYKVKYIGLYLAWRFSEFYAML